MNTLNYIGCKHTLLEKIGNIIETNIPNLKEKSLMDLFAGTGTVGFGLGEKFKSVSANDLELYSYIINSALLKSTYTKRLKDIIEICNTLTPIEGLIFRNYSPNPQCERLFFTAENAMKADAIRQYIKERVNKAELTESESNFLVASLLVSIDKVANTASVYGAYLKAFKKSALKPLVLSPIHTREYEPSQDNQVFRQKAEEIVGKVACDVLYLDPPYNQRQYAANYSPLNYIAEYADLELKGKTGLIADYNKSDFCSKVKVREAFEQVVKNSQCNYLILSYNNEGLIGLEMLKSILREKGDVKLYRIKYKKFKSFKGSQGDVEEYLWVVDVNGKKSGEIGAFEEHSY
jgi:adenine-specific DNA-methyltransferase